TNDPQAYEAYMRGRFYWNQFTHQSFPKALEAFEEAVALDPEYALAYVGIADFYNWASIYGIFPSLEYSSKVRDAALRALEIDPALGEGYAALGLYYSSIMEYEKAEENYRRAIALSPSYPHAHEWLGSSLTGTGRFEEGVKEMKIAEKLDPLSLRTKTLTAWTMYQARYFDECVAKAREIIALDPNFPQGHLQLGNVLQVLGKAEEAVEEIRKCMELMPGSFLPLYAYLFALAAAGQIEKARQVFEERIEREAGNYIAPYFLASCHLAIGETDKAFGFFEKSLEEQSHWLLWFGTEPKFDSIRSDERYFDLFKRMNNPLIEKQIEAKQQTNEGGKSIAVLPLKTLGAGDTGEDFLGIGLADALITRLSNVRNFVLRPTGNVLRYSTREVDPFQAGRELGVEYVIDGNIRRTNDRIRLTAQLIDVAGKTMRWSQSFDERFTDVLELEDLISEKVINSLLPQLAGDEQRELCKRGTDNAEAYEAYLRGRFYWNLMTEESFAKA
ncbi:MAG TPA: tetratricopeptide repeat protein, partial [Pyrinomonadaceae bacterium]|nr:tetratricopeptide repeat protein [Pyrinomonadaceae bacterium]